jgi:hypothetical protein
MAPATSVSTLAAISFDHQEGQLFRTVVACALERQHIAYRFLLGSEALAEAAKVHGCAPERLREMVAANGRGVVQPWRADEKLAALGALWELAQVRSGPVD